MRATQFLLGSAPLVLAATLALSGCDTSPPAGRPDAVAPGTYPRNIAMQGLQDGVVFGEAIVTPGTDEKPMRVVQPIRSLVDYPINVQYRFQFLDANKMPLSNNQESQRFLNLPPRTERLLDANAPDVGATDWRLEIRPAR